MTGQQGNRSFGVPAGRSDASKRKGVLERSWDFDFFLISYLWLSPSSSIRFRCLDGLFPIDFLSAGPLLIATMILFRRLVRLFV